MESHRKYLRREEVRLVMRPHTKNSAPATTFTKVPPAITRRLSALHSIATVDTMIGFPPVARHAPPCPTPSWSIEASMYAINAIPAIVIVSDVLEATAACSVSGCILHREYTRCSKAGDLHLRRFRW